MKVRRRVYVSCPISNGGEAALPEQERNAEVAIEASQALIEKGYAPLNPALTVFHERFMFDTGRLTNDHDVWLDIDRAWVLVSDALLRLPGESKGADREVRWANRAGIPVFRSLDALLDSLPPR